MSSPGPRAMLRVAPRDWAALAALVAMWGAAFALTAIAVAGMAPVWVAALRITLGAVLLWMLMRATGEVLPRDRTSWAWFGWLGFIGNMAPFVLISWAQQTIPSSLAGILVALMPIMVILLAHFLLPDEPLTRNRAFSFVFGFVGVVLLIGPAALGDISLDGMRILAELAVLLAAAGYALNAVTARLAPPVPGLVLGTGVLLAAAPQALLIAALSSPLPGMPSAATLTAVVLLGVFPTALASALLYPLLMRAGAGFVATSNYYVPCFAVLLGVSFMGESLNAFDYAGFAVILLGVIVAQHDGRSSG
ncbi:MAG: DMT family transporter [Gammaproteobacteria bacterium]